MLLLRELFNFPQLNSHHLKLDNFKPRLVENSLTNYVVVSPYDKAGDTLGHLHDNPDDVLALLAAKETLTNFVVLILIIISSFIHQDTLYTHF